MTTEKAIQLLHRLQDEQFDGIHGDERREALEMAVRALEGDGDTIYRQDAIDALNKHIDTFDAIDTNYLCGLRTAMSILKEIPSAQPERKKGKWIDGQCSICGCDIPAYIIDWKWQKDMDANYCPSCGADMRTEGNDDN
jgi:hypothetical protein